MLLHEILRYSTKINKNKIAVQDSHDKITYDDLDSLSNNFSNFLISKGIGYKDRVCIFLDKSINSLISIFGILKSGACYVPLDPNSPINRINTIIDNCSPKAIITSKDKIDKGLVNLSSTLIIAIDKYLEKDKFILWNDAIRYDINHSSKSSITENDPAYILYTSGSTGIPKGVVISHRASFVFVSWAQSQFKITSKDIVSNHAPLHFDLSILDIFSSLLGGATVVLISPETSLFPYNLSSLISKSQITIWYSVPSMLVKMVLYGKLKKLDLSNLRLILFAGEIFPTKYLKQLIEIVPKASFYNLYGPTETNVCTYYKVKKDNIEDPLPIGVTCPYNRLSLSRKRLNDTKKGNIKDNNNLIEGELCVEGPNVMSGYWKTENKTLDNSLYYTGDLVKTNNLGELIYSSRIDGMIKSRGYRIQLEEIESILHTHPMVNIASAVPVPDIESTNLIHVFIVPKETNILQKSINDKDIKKFCSQHLPRYMVPAFVSFLEKIPETHNGKINKIKLKEIAIKS